jgi:hypothetical protein
VLARHSGQCRTDGFSGHDVPETTIRESFSLVFPRSLTFCALMPIFCESYRNSRDKRTEIKPAALKSPSAETAPDYVGKLYEGIEKFARKKITLHRSNHAGEDSGRSQ